MATFTGGRAGQKVGGGNVNKLGNTRDYTRSKALKSTSNPVLVSGNSIKIIDPINGRTGTYVNGQRQSTGSSYTDPNSYVNPTSTKIDEYGTTGKWAQENKDAITGIDKGPGFLGADGKFFPSKDATFQPLGYKVLDITPKGMTPTGQGTIKTEVKIEQTGKTNSLWNNPIVSTISKWGDFVTKSKIRETNNQWNTKEGQNAEAKLKEGDYTNSQFDVQTLMGLYKVYNNQLTGLLTKNALVPGQDGKYDLSKVNTDDSNKIVDLIGKLNNSAKDINKLQEKNGIIDKLVFAEGIKKEIEIRQQDKAKQTKAEQEDKIKGIDNGLTPLTPPNFVKDTRGYTKNLLLQIKNRILYGKPLISSKDEYYSLYNDVISGKVKTENLPIEVQIQLDRQSRDLQATQWHNEKNAEEFTSLGVKNKTLQESINTISKELTGNNVNTINYNIKVPERTDYKDNLKINETWGKEQEDSINYNPYLDIKDRLTSAKIAPGEVMMGTFNTATDLTINPVIKGINKGSTSIDKLKDIYTILNSKDTKENKELALKGISAKDYNRQEKIAKVFDSYRNLIAFKESKSISTENKKETEKLLNEIENKYPELKLIYQKVNQSPEWKNLFGATKEELKLQYQKGDMKKTVLPLTTVIPGIGTGISIAYSVSDITKQGKTINAERIANDIALPAILSFLGTGGKIAQNMLSKIASPANIKGAINAGKVIDNVAKVYLIGDFGMKSLNEAAKSGDIEHFTGELAQDIVVMNSFMNLYGKIPIIKGIEERNTKIVDSLNNELTKVRGEKTILQFTERNPINKPELSNEKITTPIEAVKQLETKSIENEMGNLKQVFKKGYTQENLTKDTSNLRELANEVNGILKNERNIEGVTKEQLNEIYNSLDKTEQLKIDSIKQESNKLIDKINNGIQYKLTDKGLNVAWQAFKSDMANYDYITGKQTIKEFVTMQNKGLAAIKSNEKVDFSAREMFSKSLEKENLKQGEIDKGLPKVTNFTLDIFRQLNSVIKGTLVEEAYRGDKDPQYKHKDIDGDYSGTVGTSIGQILNIAKENNMKQVEKPRRDNEFSIKVDEYNKIIIEFNGRRNIELSPKKDAEILRKQGNKDYGLTETTDGYKLFSEKTQLKQKFISSSPGRILKDRLWAYNDAPYLLSKAVTENKLSKDVANKQLNELKERFIQERTRLNQEFTREWNSKDPREKKEFQKEFESVYNEILEKYNSLKEGYKGEPLKPILSASFADIPKWKDRSLYKDYKTYLEEYKIPELQKKWQEYKEKNKIDDMLLHIKDKINMNKENKNNEMRVSIDEIQKYRENIDNYYNKMKENTSADARFNTKTHEIGTDITLYKEYKRLGQILKTIQNNPKYVKLKEQLKKQIENKPQDQESITFLMRRLNRFEQAINNINIERTNIIKEQDRNLIHENQHKKDYRTKQGNKEEIESKGKQAIQILQYLDRKLTPKELKNERETGNRGKLFDYAENLINQIKDKSVKGRLRLALSDIMKNASDLLGGHNTRIGYELYRLAPIEIRARQAEKVNENTGPLYGKIETRTIREMQRDLLKKKVTDLINKRTPELGQEEKYLIKTIKERKGEKDEYKLKDEQEWKENNKDRTKTEYKKEKENKNEFGKYAETQRKIEALKYNIKTTERELSKYINNVPQEKTRYVEKLVKMRQYMIQELEQEQRYLNPTEERNSKYKLEDEIRDPYKPYDPRDGARGFDGAAGAGGGAGGQQRGAGNQAPRPIMALSSYQDPFFRFFGKNKYSESMNKMLKTRYGNTYS